MTDQEARYDRIAEGYATWWAPIHMPATLGLVRRVDDALAADGARRAAAGADAEPGAARPAGVDADAETPLRVLDAGCGTGLLLAALADGRPDARLTGVDLSAGMLAIARRNLLAAGTGIADRCTLVQASLDHLPFPDASFDVVTSAFVLQLVPNRHRALRELRRVLRPGGLLATLVWVAGAPGLGADEAYEAVLDAHGLGDGPAEGDATDGDAEGDATDGGATVPDDDARDDRDDRDDPLDASRAAARLRRAGFARTTAEDDTLRHRFTPQTYTGFMRSFDDEDLWASLAAQQAVDLERDLLARLQALDAGALHLELPIAYAFGRRSPRP